MNGPGKFTNPEGKEYIIELNHNKKSGHGTVIYRDYIYEGQLLNGKKEGYGKQIFFGSKTGTVYEGNWSNDKKNGTGKFNDLSGTYEGDWKDDKKNGTGSFTDK